MAITSTIEQAISVLMVTTDDDLLQEILLRLPIRSLMRFKSVSKRWLSLISHPHLALIRNPNPNPALGLLLPCAVNSKFKYIPFNPHSPSTPPFTKLEFAEDSAGIIIQQSCNGLLLCSSWRAREPKRNYYVYNPTIRQFTTLPKPGCGTGNYRIIHVITLAFDPAKSSGYKVVCVRSSELGPSYYQIEIYSSEFGCWKISGEPFAANVGFLNGVYWNGSIHWRSTWGNMTSLYFNVDKERLGVMPMPPIPDNWGGGRRITYFGESCDHLHLIEIYEPKIQFNVYEMKRDYGGWFVKYHVDLAAVAAAFPEMICEQVQLIYHRQLEEGRGWIWSVNRVPSDSYSYAFSVFSLIRGEKEEDAFLVLQIPGKAIRYNFLDKTFQTLCAFEGDHGDGSLRYNATSASQYIESLCCV